MENLKKVVGLVVEMGNVGDRVGRTKDWGQLLSLTDEVMALPGVNWSELAVEAESVDMPAMVQFVKDKLDLEDDELERKVELSIAAAASVASAVLVWVKSEEE